MGQNHNSRIQEKIGMLHLMMMQILDHIYNEEPVMRGLPKVQPMLKSCFAYRTTHTEQPELNNEGEVDQNAEQCHDTCPLPATLTDNQTTEFSNQSLESENIRLKKTVAQFQKDFLRMEAHCVNLELKYQNQVLKEGQQGQFLNVKSNEAKVKHDIDVIETINIELEHSVAKLLAENEQLHKEKEHLKQTYKDLFDSIKSTRVQTKNQNDSLMEQLNKKSNENADVLAQIQKKGFAIAALKNELRKLTGNSVNTKFAKPSILGKPVLQPHRNQSVVRQPTAFKFERPKISKPRFASLVDVPTGKIFTSSTTKVDSEPPNGSKEDITNQCESEQAFDVSAGTLLSTGLVPQCQITSDHNSSELAIQDNSNEQLSSKLEESIDFKNHLSPVARIGSSFGFFVAARSTQSCSNLSDGRENRHHNVPLRRSIFKTLIIADAVEYSKKHFSGGITTLMNKLRKLDVKETKLTAMSSAEAYNALSASSDMFTKALLRIVLSILSEGLGMRCVTPADLEIRVVYEVEVKYGILQLSINDTYVLEKDDSNVTPDSSNICNNDNQVDQNALIESRAKRSIKISLGHIPFQTLIEHHQVHKLLSRVLRNIIVIFARTSE
ncbi:hypothetical protein Tco_1282381 [Tanacetum coccineum]